VGGCLMAGHGAKISKKEFIYLPPDSGVKTL
jgi:hypothetical protein